MATGAYAHIDVTPEGVPMIAGTKTKVVEIVLDQLAYHWDADEIHRQHSHLTLGQIYSALAYYHDHMEEMDRDIAAGLKHVHKIKAGLGGAKGDDAMSSQPSIQMRLFKQAFIAVFLILSMGLLAMLCIWLALEMINLDGVNWIVLTLVATACAIGMLAGLFYYIGSFQAEREPEA